MILNATECCYVYSMNELLRTWAELGVDILRGQSERIDVELPKGYQNKSHNSSGTRVDSKPGSSIFAISRRYV
jgi:hypothetical protein